MKISALILLIPCVIFLTETATFTEVLKKNCGMVSENNGTCGKTTGPTPCSGKKDNSSCSKAKKNNATNSNPKDKAKGTADNKCKEGPNCTTCPICYTFLLESQYEVKEQEFPVVQTLEIDNTEYLSSYTNSVWKPPNDSFMIFP